MKKLVHSVIGFLFPETDIESRLRRISQTTFFEKAQPQNHPKLTYCVSFYSYKDPLIKDMIWAFKYKGKKELAKLFAVVMHDYLLEEQSDEHLLGNFKNPVLIPIPISSSRKLERGYNQTELIINELLKLQSGTVGAENKVLRKHENKEHQARTKSKGSRKKNIVGTFYIKHPEKIENKNIILIDDVITTGATLEEARKALLDAGAKEVRALTVAH